MNHRRHNQRLTQSCGKAKDNNSGALQLKNSAGGVLVDVGAIDANTGYAQVYPRSGKAPFPIPNYLKGSK